VRGFKPRRIPMSIVGIAMAVTIAGCGKSATQVSRFSPPINVTPPTAHATPAPSHPRYVRIKLTPAYKSFISSVCAALRKRDAQSVSNSLEYTAANTGLYYGTFNKSEGTMAMDVLGTLNDWFNGSKPTCFKFAPSQADHGVVATNGWGHDGGWAVLDLDKLNGAWKVDDFTFGNRGSVMHALYSTSPEVVSYPPK
jgi:hypothetical protein